MKTFYRDKRLAAGPIGRGRWRLLILATSLMVAAAGLLWVSQVNAQVSFTLTVTQTSTNTVKAEIKTSDNNLYTAHSAEWRVVVGGQSTICELDPTYNNPTLTRNNQTGSITVTQAMSDGDNLCVKVTLNTGDSSDVRRAGTTIDLTKPMITTLSQTGAVINVSVSDDYIDWTSNSGPVLSRLTYKVDSSTCDSTTTSMTNSGVETTDQTTSGSTTSFTITGHGATHGQKICVRFEDKFGNAAYKEYTHKAVGPKFTNAAQQGTGGSASLTVIAATRVKWQDIDNFTINTTDNTASDSCGTAPESASYDTIARLSKTYTVDASGGGWTCIWAQDPSTSLASPAIIVLDRGFTTDNPPVVFQSGPSIQVLAPAKSSVNYSVVPAGAMVFDMTMTANAEAAMRYRLVTHGSGATNRAVSEDCTATGSEGLFNSAYNQSTHPDSTVTSPPKSISGNMIKLTSTASAICVEVKDGRSSSAYAWKDLASFDTTQPYIVPGVRAAHMKDIEVSFVANASYSVNYWYQGQARENTDTSCNAVDHAPITGQIAGSRQKSKIKLSLLSNEVNRYFCVRVNAHHTTDGSSNFYAWVYTGTSPIDVTAPVITISQNKAVVTATATDSGSGDDAATWEYAVLENTVNNLAKANNKCHAEPSPETPKITWKKGATATLSSTDSNRYICFRVSDNAGNTGYKHSLVSRITDSTPPTISVTQDGNMLTYEASDVGGTVKEDSHEYIALETKPASCKASTIDWKKATKGSLKAFTESDNGKHYCFRVQDSNGLTGYSSVLSVTGVDTTKPTLTINQANNKIVAIADETVSDWGYLQSAADPKCDGSSTMWASDKERVPGSSINELKAADVGTWVCFRAKDAANNYGYKKQQIAALVDVVTPPTDDDADDDDDDNQPIDPGTDPGDDQEPVQPPADTPENSVTFTMNEDGMTVDVGLESDTAQSHRYLFWATDNLQRAEALAQDNCDADGQVAKSTNPGTRSSIDLNRVTEGEMRYYCYIVTDSSGNAYYGVYEAQNPADITVTPDDDTIEPDPDDDITEPVTPPVDPTPTDPVDPGGTDPTDPTDPGTDPADPGADEDNFLAQYWIWIVAVVVLAGVAVVFIAMGAKGNRE